MGWDFTPATLARAVGRHGWAAPWAGTARPHGGIARPRLGTAQPHLGPARPHLWHGLSRNVRGLFLGRVVMSGWQEELHDIWGTIRLVCSGKYRGGTPSTLD